jgi:hypothetical protein
MLSSGPDGVESVLKLRDEMVERGLELGRPGYAAVADAFAERGDIENVDATFAEMHACDFSGAAAFKPVLHCIRMKAMCNAGRLDDAIAVLSAEDSLDAACFNLALFQCAKLSDKHRAITVLRAMEAAEVEPDAISYRAMSGFMRSLALTLRTFDERFRNGIFKLAQLQSVRDDPSQREPPKSL